MSEEQKIGRYAVQHLLGEGAMGSVFKAFDPFIKRTVAIKTIKVDRSRNAGDTKEFYDRFLQEAQISGILNHPNIVGIFDVGEQDGMPYIAMEYVEGKTLDEILNEQPRPSMGVLIRYIMQIAYALDFAHENDIVHRDLKPSNIMVMNTGVAKIMDFGIAKRSGTNLTQTGVFLGTPSYCSPEQIKEGHVDARSDIFSLAILAHETLTGHLPFPGQTINAILYKIANEPPIFAPNLNQLHVDLAAWRHTFHKALDKDPERRFQKASAFANALYESVNLSKEEKAEVGRFMGKMGVAVRDAFGVQKDLRRSEFEMGRATEVSVVAQSARREKSSTGAWLITLIVLIGLGVTGFYLWENRRWEGYWQQAKDMLGIEETAEVVPDPLIANLEKSLTIQSDPPGAQVTVGEQILGPAPQTYTWTGQTGDELTIRMTAEGFEDHETQLILTEELVPEITAKLAIGLLKRTITSEPAGANVYVGNRKQGVTPFELETQSDTTYRVRLTLAGYLTASRTYREGKTDPDKLNFTLKKAPPPGKVQIETEMEDLKAVVDGRTLQSDTFSLPAGDYSINLSSRKYFYRETKQVSLTAGKTRRVPTPALITIPKIEFIGGYVRVKIDGKFVLKDGQPDTTPIIGLKISAGTHKFEFIGQDDKIVGQQITEVNQSVPIIAAADP